MTTMTSSQLGREILKRLNPREWVVWVYREVDEAENGHGLKEYQVGYYTPQGEWVPEPTRYLRRGEAAARVRFLMGGN